MQIAQRRATRPGSGVFAGRPHTLIERALLALRTSNAVVFASGFVEPVFFLAAFGFGLGGVIGTIDTGSAGVVSYAAYIAPALLATSAMNGALADATWNVFFKMHFGRIYNAMLSTSLGALDVALGEIGWALLRGGAYAVGFMTVLWPLGLIVHPGALLAIPAAVLVAFGFAAAGMAMTSYMESIQQLNWVNFWLLPMFLFSGTFYPLDVYPQWLQQVIHLLPLWQAIELLRSLMLGVFDLSLLGHVAYFLGFVAIGLTATTRRLSALFLR